MEDNVNIYINIDTNEKIMFICEDNTSGAKYKYDKKEDLIKGFRNYINGLQKEHYNFHFSDWRDE